MINTFLNTMCHLQQELVYQNASAFCYTSPVIVVLFVDFEKKWLLVCGSTQEARVAHVGTMGLYYTAAWPMGPCCVDITV